MTSIWDFASQGKNNPKSCQKRTKKRVSFFYTYNIYILDIFFIEMQMPSLWDVDTVSETSQWVVCSKSNRRRMENGYSLGGGRADGNKTSERSALHIRFHGRPARRSMVIRCAQETGRKSVKERGEWAGKYSYKCRFKTQSTKRKGTYQTLMNVERYLYTYMDGRRWKIIHKCNKRRMKRRERKTLAQTTDRLHPFFIAVRPTGRQWI